MIRTLAPATPLRLPRRQFGSAGRRWVLALGAGFLLALSSHARCPQSSQVDAAMFIGNWIVQWTDGARQRGEAPWRLQLGPHPEYPGSLKGSLSRGQQVHAVVADWDEGVLTMEESEDGQRISATWQASLQTIPSGAQGAQGAQGASGAWSCPIELRGLRFTGEAPDESNSRRFRMRSEGAR